MGQRNISTQQQSTTNLFNRDSLADVIDDARLLGAVRYTTQNNSTQLLHKKYFIDLVALITFHVRVEFKTEKTRLLERRRKLYSDASSIEDD